MDPFEDIFPLPALKKGTAAGKFQPKGRPALRKPTCSLGTSTLPGKDKKQAVSPSTAMSDTTKSSENVGPKDDRLTDPNASPLVSLDSFGKMVPRSSESSQLAVDHMGLMSTSSELVVQQEVGISDALPSDVVVPNQNVEDSFVFEEFNGEMDAGMDDDLISNILPHPLAPSAILPSRDINGTRYSDLPASNYLESIAASISDAAQPHIHSSFCEKETQDMAMDGRDAASVSGYSCIDKDRSETEEAETFPDVQTTDGSHERISASGVGRPEREDLLETELPSGVGKPTFCITNSEVEPGDLPRDLLLCETHLDQGSARASIPDDIFDYSSIRLEDSTFGNPTVHEPSHSDTLISANTMDVSDVPGDLNDHHKETWAASDICLMQDKSCMSNTTSEGNKSSRQLRKRPPPCQFVDASDDEVHSDGNNSAEAHTHSPSNGDELCDGDEYWTLNSSLKNAPRKSEGPLAKKQKQERKKEGNKASEKSTGEPRKKFSHSTRRGKRCVDKVLLQTPEDEIDYRKLRIRDLILLAEHKERLTVKKAKPSKANSNNQSVDKSTQGDASHKEGESLPSEQGKEPTNEARSAAEAAPLLFNYQSFMEKTPRTRWSKQDTELFYEGIRQFGTDLSMIKELFPKLTRQQIKLKFKKEERQNRLGLSEALASRAKDHSHFELVIERLQAAAQAGKESSRDVSASMTAEEEDGESSPETNEEAEKPEKDAEIGDEDGKGDAEVHDSSKSDDSDDDLFNCLSSYKSEL
ncbi:SANT domain-containing protein [Psidium guajava]|nr:SANT domain-containing protein [Psidium guajava]